MNRSQLLVYENDGWLAAQVKELCRENGWLLREPRQTDACLDLLRESRPSVLLLKLERKLIDELSLLATVRERLPECPVIVFSDVKFDSANQRATLAALAYDLGARYVMFPPLTHQLVEDLTVGLMLATIQRFAQLRGAAAHA